MNRRENTWQRDMWQRDMWQRDTCHITSNQQVPSLDYICINVLFATQMMVALLTKSTIQNVRLEDRL